MLCWVLEADKYAEAMHQTNILKSPVCSGFVLRIYQGIDVSEFCLAPQTRRGHAHILDSRKSPALYRWCTWALTLTNILKSTDV